MLVFPTAEKDSLFELTHHFRADPRPQKLDLVLGVYRDDHGQTPVMEAVYQAELQLAKERHSKAYRALSGHAEFNTGMVSLLLGNAAPRQRDVAVIQTVGGTGALRVLADVIAASSAEGTSAVTVWSSDPGYVNHGPICEGAGLAVKPYRLRSKGGMVDIDPLLEDLAAARSGDVVLLHGCCHNPTGLDMDLEAWAHMANVCERRGLIPFVDMAYQGFGLGLEEDAAGLRLLVDRLETVLVAASCSKNMGLYRERTGAALVITPAAQDVQRASALMENIARASYSMPPDHGAAVGALVFQQNDLWRTELEIMRQRVVRLRHQLADALQHLGAPEPLLEVRHHRGMFSVLPLTTHQMQFLRQDYAVYGTDGGRINVAGLTEAAVPYLANALVQASQA